MAAHKVEQQPYTAPRNISEHSKKIYRFLVVVIIAALYLLTLSSRPDKYKREGQCIQFEPLYPESSEAIRTQFALIQSPEYRKQSAQHLSGAVKIPSISYDDMGLVGEDDRWKVFGTLAEYLETTFPNVHSKLSLTKVDEYGLLYTWKGSDSQLKPVVLMAHQDVVPVDSLDQWQFPPFSGHITEDHVYGRGASDCKNVLIGIFEAIESLILASFTPDRTILLSFGTDEESKGLSAGKLSQYIQSLYGKSGISLILDEGAAFTDLYGQIFATPGIAEKGYLDAVVTVNMPGGHSSVPPDHTAIGVLSELLIAIEQHQYAVRLRPENPLVPMLTCSAEFSPNFPSKWKQLIHSKKYEKLAKILKTDPEYRYLMATSVAETVVHGGLKSNALPESVTAVINHRIALDESSEFVKATLTKLARPIANKHALMLNSFNDKPIAPSSIHITSGLDTLDPAPITPTDSTAWKVLAGTIRAVFPSVYVAGLLSTGNTDTKSYWNLSKNIFRFEPSLHGSLVDDQTNIHTINERMSIEGHLELVRFFFQFIQNVQGDL